MSFQVRSGAQVPVVSVLLGVVAALGGASPARAQPPGQPLYTPTVHGQWAGPYDLVEITGEHPNVPLFEISHAVVLPDADGAVLFWCHVYPNTYDTLVHGGQHGPTHTFLWRPNDPQRVTKKDVPNKFDGSQDLFCGGHQFLRNGDVLAFGGTDLTKTSVTGHASAFRFDLATGGWQAAGAMLRERWYPNGFPTPIGMVVLGHTEGPIYGSPELPTEAMQDRFFTSGAWDSSPVFSEPRLRNAELLGLGGVPCGAPVNVASIHDYPRCHLLASGPTLQFLDTRLGARDWRMDFSANCTTAPAERWVSQNSLMGVQHAEGSTAHYVFLGAAPTSPTDRIVLVAGRERISMTHAAQSEVETWTSSAGWNDPNEIAIPDLNEGRVDQNLVILADGSLLVVGGSDVHPAGQLTDARLNPERFVAGNFPLPDANDAWIPMAPHQHERRYHSVAGLLPDGRVFVAGGDNSNDNAVPEASHHSVEIYSPPYLFQGPRPLVSGLTATNWDLSAPTPQPPSFTVQFRPGMTLERVALIKTGSITHAFDASQRYVVLRVASISPDPLIADAYSVTVDLPPSYFATPHGDYMLVALSTSGVPSVGTMVQIQ